MIEPVKDNTKPVTFTKEDLAEFHRDAILTDNKGFQKVYNLPSPDGALRVVMKTRTGAEASDANRRISNEKISQAEVMEKLLTYNLVYALQEINGKMYNTGTFEERLEIIQKFPAPKMHLLWLVLTKFDEMCNMMRMSYENF